MPRPLRDDSSILPLPLAQVSTCSQVYLYMWFCFPVDICFVTALQKRRRIISGKFRVKLGDGVNDTYEKILDLDALPPLRTSTNIDRTVRAFICQDRRLTIRMITDELIINECIVHQILTQNLNMRQVCAKMIPKI